MSRRARIVLAIALLSILSYVGVSQTHLFGALDRANSWLLTQTFTAIVDSGLAPGTIICTDSARQLTTSGCPSPGGGVTGSGTLGRHPVWGSSTSLADSLWNFEDSSQWAVCTNGSCTQPGGVLQMSFSGTTSSAIMRADSMTLRANSGNLALLTGAGNSVALGGSAGIIPDISFAGNSVTSHIKMSLTSAQATTLDLATLFVSCQTGTTCSPVPISAPSIITGRTSLTGGTATVSSIAPAFAGTTTEACFGMDTSTPANIVTVTIASTSSITLTGTGTDFINWTCISR